MNRKIRNSKAFGEDSKFSAKISSIAYKNIRKYEVLEAC